MADSATGSRVPAIPAANSLPLTCYLTAISRTLLRQLAGRSAARAVGGQEDRRRDGRHGAEGVGLEVEIGVVQVERQQGTGRIAAGAEIVRLRRNLNP